MKYFLPFLLPLAFIRHIVFLLFFSRNAFKKLPSRVFVIPQRFLGDIIITSQIFDNLIKLNPDVKFVILQYNSKICQKIYTQRLGKNLQEVINYNGLFNTILKIFKAGRFDVCVRFASSSARRGILFLFVRSFFKHTIVREKHIIKKKLSDGNAIKQNISSKNYLQFCCDKLNKIFNTNFKPSFYLPLVFNDQVVKCLSIEQKNKLMNKFFGTKQSTNIKKIAVLAAGASFYAKMWPAEHFNQIAIYLKNLGFYVCLIEGTMKHEESFKDKITHDFLIKTSLPFDDVFNLISISNLCICNDSGFAHASVALGVNTIVIPAFTSMDVYGYKFLPNFYCPTNNIECYPCNMPAVNKNCPYFKSSKNGKVKCIENHGVEDVKTIIDYIIAKKEK